MCWAVLAVPCSQSSALVPSRPFLSKGNRLPCAEQFPGGRGTTGQMLFVEPPVLRIIIIIRERTTELSIISRAGGVLAIWSEPPGNRIGLVRQCYIPYYVPQIDELQHLLLCRNAPQSPHPGSSLRHRQPLTPTEPEQSRCDFFGCLATEPWVMPELCCQV
jgi:hypothetical protein